MVARDDQVERIDGEPLAVVLELEQLRDRAVEVDGEARLEGGGPVEERGERVEVLRAEQDGLRAAVDEGDVAAVGVEGWRGKVSAESGKSCKRGVDLQPCVRLISAPLRRTPSSSRVHDCGARGYPSSP